MVELLIACKRPDLDRRLLSNSGSQLDLCRAFTCPFCHHASFSKKEGILSEALCCMWEDFPDGSTLSVPATSVGGSSG